MQYKKTDTLGSELWLMLVKFAIANTALSIGNDPISGLIKAHIMGRVKNFCGTDAETACQQILDINAELVNSKSHQRRVQCFRLRKADLLSEEMLADLLKADWPTTDTFERIAYVKGTAECDPHASINQIRRLGNLSINLGQTVMELNSLSLLNKLLELGFRDYHENSSTCLEGYFKKKDVNAVRLLLANERYRQYPATMFFEFLIEAIVANDVKLVEVCLSLPIDYVVHHNYLIAPFMDFLQGDKICTEVPNIKSKKKIVKLLCEYRNPVGKGFDLDIPGKDFNALITAILARQNDLLFILLNHVDASIVKRVINQILELDGVKITVLGLAVGFNQYALAKQLLEAGANPNLPEDDIDNQPLALTNSFDIRLLLQQHGAKANSFRKWNDFDLNGRIVKLRPLIAEALFGSAESLQRVLSNNDFGSVDMMIDDAAAPLLYSIARLTGIIDESVFHNQNDMRRPYEIVDDCVKKFTLLVNAGANINAPAFQGSDLTLIDVAVYTSTVALVKLLAPFKPKISNSLDQFIGMQLNITPKGSKFLPLATTLVEEELINDECFYKVLGFSIACGNVLCCKMLLDNLSKYKFDDERKRFLSSSLWFYFTSKDKSKFYDVLNLVLWMTDTQELPQINNVSAEQAKLYAIYTNVIKGKIAQTKASKEQILAQLKKLNRSLTINSTWEFRANLFSCAVSVRQSRRLLNNIPDAKLIENPLRVTLIIDDPKFQIQLPEANAQIIKEPALSSRHFLTEKGYSAAEIEALQKPSQLDAQSTPVAATVKVTWCDGKISSADENLICIENTNPPRFLFIDRTHMLNSGCSENDLEKLIRVRRFGDTEKRCISSIKGKLRDVIVKVQLCDNILTVPIKGEIRDADIEARLLCGPAIKSDQGGAKLYVAVAYISSMHNDGNIDNLLRVLESGKIIELNYEQPKTSKVLQ